MLCAFKWRWRSTRFYDRRGECAGDIQLFGDDGSNYIEIEAGVFVDGDVAEADHSFHMPSKIGGENPCCL